MARVCPESSARFVSNAQGNAGITWEHSETAGTRASASAAVSTLDIIDAMAWAGPGEHVGGVPDNPQ